MARQGVLRGGAAENAARGKGWGTARAGIGVAGTSRPGLIPGPVAKFGNGRGMGRAGPHFTTAIRGQPSLKAEPIRPFLDLLTNFATGLLWGRINAPQG